MFDGNGALRHAGLCEHLDFTGREQPSYVDKKGCNMIQRYKLNINGTYRCIWHREDDIRLPQNEGCTHIYRDEPQYIYIYIYCHLNRKDDGVEPSAFGRYNFFRKSWMTEQHIKNCHIGYTSVLWKTGIVKHECLVMLICFIEMWGNLLVKTCGFRLRPPEISGNLVTHTFRWEQWYFQTCFGSNHVLQAVIGSMPSFTVP